MGRDKCRRLDAKQTGHLDPRARTGRDAVVSAIKRVASHLDPRARTGRDSKFLQYTADPEPVNTVHIQGRETKYSVYQFATRCEPRRETMCTIGSHLVFIISYF